MRMAHIFLAGALLLVPAMGWTACSGFTHDGSQRHFWLGLLTASFGSAVHTLLILFVLITRRLLRAAPPAHASDAELLVRRRALPLAGLAALAMVAAGVLGNAARGFGISPAWHWGAGLFAVCLNLWALREGYVTLLASQRFSDRVGEAVGREAPPSVALSRWSLSLAAAVWFPYFYWALFEHRGDFSRVSVHPWVEASTVALLVWLLARRD